METVSIYLDIFFFYNFFLNLLLIFLTAFSSDRPFRIGRGSLAAVLGSLFSCGFLFLNIHGAAQFVVQLAVVFVMITVAFSSKKIGDILKLGLLYYLLSFMLAGGIEFSGNLFSQKYVTPFAVMAGVLFLLCCGGLFFYFLKKKAVSPIGMILVEYEGKKVMLRGFSDTGNNLTDPISHASVIVVKQEILLDLIHPKTTESINNIRLIPCATVTAKEGTLWGIKPNAVFCNNKPVRAVLAASDMLKSEDYDAIFNPAILLS